MNSYLEAKERIPSMAERIVNRLKDAGLEGVTNVELSQDISLRYGGCLGTLYKQGYKIDCEFIGDGVYKYTLIEEPKIKQKPKKAVDRLLETIKSDYNDAISSEDLLNILNTSSLYVAGKAGTYKM